MLQKQNETRKAIKHITRADALLKGNMAAIIGGGTGGLFFDQKGLNEWFCVG